MYFYLIICPAILYILAGIFEAALDVSQNQYYRSIFACVKNKKVRAWFRGRELGLARYIHHTDSSTLTKRWVVLGNKIPNIWRCINNGQCFFTLLKNVCHQLAPFTIIFFVYRRILTGEPVNMLVINIVIGWIIYWYSNRWSFKLFARKIFLRRHHRTAF